MGGSGRAALLRVVFVVATVLAAALSARLTIDPSVAALLPAGGGGAELARFLRLFAAAEPALVLVRGASADEVDAASKDVARALEACPGVSAVFSAIPDPPSLAPSLAWAYAGPSAREKLAWAVSEEGMRERVATTRALLLTPSDDSMTEALARDPLRLAQIPWDSAVEAPSGSRAAAGSPLRADEGRARLVLVRAAGSALARRDARAAATAIEACIAPTRALFPSVRVAATGPHAMARETEELLRSDLARSGTLALALASAVFVAVMRRPRALLAIVPPLVAGSLWTTGLARLVTAEVSGIATAFAAVVVGVGFDTGIHVYGALLTARRDGHQGPSAARRARATSERPTMAAALTAGLAFATLALSDVPGMRQLGLLCAGGEVLTAVAILAVVPEIGAWLERSPPPPPPPFLAMASLVSTPRRARAWLVLAACVVVASAVFSRPPTSAHVVALRSRALTSVAVYDEIYALFGGAPGQWVALSEGASRAEAQARADRIAEAAERARDAGELDGYDGSTRLLPASATVEARLRARDSLDLPSRADMLRRTLDAAGFAPDEMSDAIAELAHPRPQSDLVADALLPPLLRNRYLAEEGGVWLAATYLRPRAGSVSPEATAQAILSASEHTSLTGMARLESSLATSLASSLPVVAAAAGAVALLALGASLRRARHVALAALVVATELALVAAVMSALSIPLHVYDALVIPVLLGITLDEVVFLLSAATDGRSLREAIAEQGPLTSATALSTAAGFGALALCRFEGLAHMGLVGAAGSLAGLLCALVLVPAGLAAFPGSAGEATAAPPR